MFVRMAILQQRDDVCCFARKNGGPDFPGTVELKISEIKVFAIWLRVILLVTGGGGGGGGSLQNDT